MHSLSWFILHVLSAQTTTTTTLGGISFTYSTVPEYQWNGLDNIIKMNFAYAKPDISNSEAWSPASRKGKIPYEIDLVYTRYPPDSLKWITPYDRLLNQRVEHLLQLDPELKNANIKWNLIAQTACTTAVLAETFFHGWVIKYTVPSDDTEEDFYDLNGKVDYEKRSQFYLSQVKQIINGKVAPKDTTVLTLLERKKDRWNDLLVVMDWTSSMYEHGAQVIRWHRQHLEQNKLKHLVLFNDGDDFIRKSKAKPLGYAGGIYFVDPKNLDQILEAMLTVIQRGDGGDVPENNCEAILKAIEKHPDAEQVVLIADARADIRDLALADRIQRPVHIILCGSWKRLPSPDYLTLAWKTGGSIANMEAELTFKSRKEMKFQGNVRFGSRRFVYNAHDGRFENYRD